MRTADSLHRATRTRSTPFDNTSSSRTIATWSRCRYWRDDASTALYAVWYNFIRIHKTLRVTPAMESGIEDHLFSFEDLIGIVDEWEVANKAA